MKDGMVREGDQCETAFETYPFGRGRLVVTDDPAMLRS
jgi:hypothetical protein